MAKFAAHLRATNGWSNKTSSRYANALGAALSAVDKNWEDAPLADEFLVKAWRAVDDLELSAKIPRPPHNLMVPLKVQMSL